MRFALALLFRGFLLQALYNSRGQQRGGLHWILAGRPGLPTQGPFNTNPTLAGYAIGLGASRPDALARVGPALTAALGGLGDRLQLGLLRPLAVVASLIGALAGPVPAAAALLLVYNPPEIYLRWRSLVRGLEGETRILADLGRGGISKIGQVLSRLLGLGVGCVAGLVLAPLIAAGRYQDALGGAFGVLVSIWLFRRRMDPIKVAPVAALAMGAAWLLFEGILLRRGGWLLAAVCLD